MSSTGEPDRDIAGREDLERLLRAFYDRVLQDPLLRPVFVDVARTDLEQHLPVICDFWEQVLLGGRAYRGRALDVHRRLHRRVPLRPELFERWLDLWDRSLDERFRGPVAEQARRDARRTADALQRELHAPPQGVRTLRLVAAPRP